MPVMTIIKDQSDPKSGSKEVQILEYRAESLIRRADCLAIEEPLEICVVTQEEGMTLTHNIAITMRTPGADAELAIGFLLSEGALADAEMVASTGHAVDNAGAAICNRVLVTLKPGSVFDVEKFSRHVFTSSSCGICGKMTIDRIHAQGLTRLEPRPLPAPEWLMTLPDRLREHQRLFKTTGGLHGAGLFEAAGPLIAVREDVGRHNAVDKLLGFLFLNKRIPATNQLLMLSGRASFELLQKAISAGISHVAAVGAPSSLAVELAKAFNVNLIGFLSDKRFNIYHAAEESGNPPIPLG